MLHCRESRLASAESSPAQQVGQGSVDRHDSTMTEPLPGKCMASGDDRSTEGPTRIQPTYKPMCCMRKRGRARSSTMLSGARQHASPRRLQRNRRRHPRSRVDSWLPRPFSRRASGIDICQLHPYDAEDLGGLVGDRRSDALTLGERRPDSVPPRWTT